MLNFEAKTSTEDDRCVVSLSGECDLTVRAALAAALDDALDRSRVVMLDLAELRFLDSSGIHELVTAYHRACEGQRQLYVRNASGVVAAVLDLTGVATLLSPPADGDGATRDSAGA